MFRMPWQVKFYMDTGTPHSYKGRQILFCSGVASLWTDGHRHAGYAHDRFYFFFSGFDSERGNFISFLKADCLLVKKRFLFVSHILLKSFENITVMSVHQLYVQRLGRYLFYFILFIWNINSIISIWWYFSNQKSFKFYCQLIPASGILWMQASSSNERACAIVPTRTQCELGT